MCSLLLLFLFFLGNIETAFAVPFSYASQSQKRGNSAEEKNFRRSRDAGIGVGLAILVILLLVLAFYLGRRVEQYGSWRCWTTADETSLTSTPKTILRYEEEPHFSADLKHRFESSYDLSSTYDLSPPVPAELHSLQVEHRPRYLELPSNKEVYELGQRTPRTPRTPMTPREMGLSSPRSNHSNQSNNNRRSWTSRAWWRHRQTVQPVEINPAPKKRPASALSLPAAAFLNANLGKNERKVRRSMMDWRGSGLEHVREVQK